MKIISLCGLLILLLVSRSSLTTSQENDDEREFDYIPGSGKGPEHWGDLNENWTTCKTGLRQSPIDFCDGWVDVVRHLGRLQTSYKPANSTLVNRGHDIMLKWDNAGSMKIEGTEYDLIQCHWHSPSEHTINGQRFALEVHMVHQSSEGKIAVVGIVYKWGPPDPFLFELMDHLKILVDGHVNETVVGVTNPYDLKMASCGYYRYMGSLTTPPCTEGVTWTVLEEREPWLRTASIDQLLMLRNAVHDYARDNARPLQPLNGREVLLYDPGHHPTSLQSI